MYLCLRTHGWVLVPVLWTGKHHGVLEQTLDLKFTNSLSGCHAGRPWASHFTSLSLCLLTNTTHMAIPISFTCFVMSVSEDGIRSVLRVALCVHMESKLIVQKAPWMRTAHTFDGGPRTLRSQLPYTIPSSTKGFRYDSFFRLNQLNPHEFTILEIALQSQTLSHHARLGA